MITNINELLQRSKRVSTLLNFEPKEHHMTNFGIVSKILRSRKISLPVRCL